MSKECLFENEHLRIEYSKKGNFLVAVYKGYFSFENFRKLIDTRNKFLKEKNATGMILDTRMHKGAGAPSIEYAAKVMEEFVKENYPVRQAVILPVDIFSRLSVESYSKMLDGRVKGLEIKFFDKMTDAENWMME